MPISKQTRRRHARLVLSRLRKHYTKPGPFVAWSRPLELAIGTVLSAQCTDERVNRITKRLFKKYRSARAYARADIKILEQEIYSTGFYKSKARYLKGIGQRLISAYGGRVPDFLGELLTLPGISYKTAHLVMAKAFGKNTGVAVDTHVKRVAPRLGWTKHTDVKKIAHDLERLFSKKDYLDVNEYLITHGRALCKPRPLCGDCLLNDVCPFGQGALKASRKKAG